MRRITKLLLADLLRHRIILIYAGILAALSWTVFLLEDTGNKGLLTLLNLVLLVVPLVSVLFGSIYLYNSAEFIELLVSQPLRRRQIWISLFISLATALILAFLGGVALPLLLYAQLAPALALILSGCLLTVIFLGIAFFTTVLSRDKSKGIGAAILIWLFFSLLYDGLLLFLLFQLSDYPIETPMAILAALNPIDMARLFNLLQIDSAAMLGYSGAIFHKLFGSGGGIAVSCTILAVWCLVPFAVSVKLFNRKDL